MNATTIPFVLLCAAAPIFTMTAAPAPTQSGAEATTQDLERKVREALGEMVDQKAKELAERLRGVAGTAGSADGADGDEDLGGDEDDVAGADPLTDRLVRIEDRLAGIESLLCDLSARSVPCSQSVPAAATSVNPATVPVAAPEPALGAAVSTGFVGARVRTWHQGREVTIKLSVNGMPAGRFDTNTTLDLAPFLRPGRANQVAFTVEPHGKADASGVEVYVEAQLPDSEKYVAILQFKASKERLSDTLDVPWAPR